MSAGIQHQRIAEKFEHTLFIQHMWAEVGKRDGPRYVFVYEWCTNSVRRQQTAWHLRNLRVNVAEILNAGRIAAVRSRGHPKSV